MLSSTIQLEVRSVRPLLLYQRLWGSHSITGPVVKKVGATKLPFGQIPLLLYNGEVSCQTLTAKLSIVRLTTHVFNDEQGMSEEEVSLSIRCACLVSRLFLGITVEVILKKVHCS